MRQVLEARTGRLSAGSLPRCELYHFTTRQRRARSGDHCPCSKDSFHPEIHTTSSSNQSPFQPCPPISISIEPPKPRFVPHKHGSPASPKGSTPNHRSIRALHLAASPFLKLVSTLCTPQTLQCLFLWLSPTPLAPYKSPSLRCHGRKHSLLFRTLFITVGEICKTAWPLYWIHRKHKCLHFYLIFMEQLLSVS